MPDLATRADRARDHDGEWTSLPRSWHSQYVSKHRVAFNGLLLAALSAALRFPHLKVWLLPNVDEIVLKNTLNQPLLAAATASSSYWPVQLLLATLAPLRGILDWRYLAATAGTIGLVALYLLLRSNLGDRAAFFLSAGLSLHWYFVYTSRIAEVASFAIPALIFSVALIRLELAELSGRYLPYLAATLALGFSTWAPPFFYLAASFLLVAALNWRAWKPVPKPRLLLTATLFLVLLAPYAGAVARLDTLKSSILERYSFSGSPESSLRLSALAYPTVPVRTWTSLATVYSEQVPHPVRRTYAIAALIAILSLGIPRITATQSARSTWQLLVALILLCILSPLPAYIEGHLAPILLVALLVLCDQVTHGRGHRRLVALGVSATLVLPSLAFLPRVAGDQVSQVERLLNPLRVENVPLALSFGALEKLNNVPRLSRFAAEAESFPCIGTESAWRPSRDALSYVVVTTSECNIAALLAWSSPEPDRLLSLNSLLESHLHHGIEIWRATQPSG